MKKLLIAITLICSVLTPVIAFSDVGDIFNCSTSGTSAASAGSTRPLGGPYVPTADYAVELNTGLLVYKECVLREIVTANRKAAAAQLDQLMLQQFNAYPSRELGHEEVKVADQTIVRYLLQNDSLSGFNDAVRQQVRQSISDAYTKARDPRKSFACDYTGDLSQVLAGSPTGNYWDAFDAVTNNPACSPFSASAIGYSDLMGQVDYELYKNKEQLDWGNGVYGVSHLDDNGFRIIDTPGKIVLDNGVMAEQSGYKQLEQADDIGELTDKVYSNVANQILTPSSNLGTGTGAGTGGTAGGLANIASYMATVVSSALGDYTGTTGNSVIALIQQARDIEKQYHDILAASANLLTQEIASIRSKQTGCYTALENAICQSGSVSGTKCTSTGGSTIDFSNQPDFAQKQIDTLVRPQVNPLTTAVNSAQSKLDSLNGLLTSLGSSPSQSAQTAAIASLNTINPDKDITGAQSAQSSLATTIATQLTNTTNAWTADGAWCANPDPSTDAGKAVIKTWTDCWSGTASACPTP